MVLPLAFHIPSLDPIDRAMQTAAFVVENKAWVGYTRLDRESWWMPHNIRTIEERHRLPPRMRLRHVLRTCHRDVQRIVKSSVVDDNAILWIEEEIKGE
jgi:hypothetical protein